MRTSWLSIAEVTRGWPLATVVVLGGLAVVGGEARAALIGNSAPTLACSSSTNCSGGGSSLLLGQSGMGSTPWTLSTTGNSINSPVPSTTPVSLGTLSFSTGGNNVSGTPSFVWDVVLNLTSPSGGTSSEMIPLALSAGSGSGSSATEILSTFPLTTAAFVPPIPGVTLSFLYAEGGTGGSFDSTAGTWTVTRGTGAGNIATLTLEANLTAAPPPGVPEPASLTLLGTALAGLGAAFGWRRRKPADAG